MQMQGIGDLFTKREAVTQAYAGLVLAATGSYPKVKRGDEYTTIKLSEKQIIKGQELLKKLLGREPGDVRIEGINDIMTPVFMKKYLGWIIGVPVALIVLGGILKR